MPKRVVALRQTLWTGCIHRLRKKAHSCVCLRPVVNSAAPGGVAHADYAAIVDAYNRSTFCVQPPGDTPTRKGIIDALLLGCIPVLFDPAQRAQWPWHWGDWAADASVLLNGTAARLGQLDVIAALEAIPAARVREMRATIAQQAHRLQYATHDSLVLRSMGVVGDTYEDAFDAVLRRAWERAQGRELQSRGAKMQAAAPTAKGRWQGVAASGDQAPEHGRNP